MDARIKALVESDAFWEELVPKMAEKQRAQRAERMAFAASEVFGRLRDTLLAAPANTGFDSEEMAYFPERVKARLGWGFANDEDVSRFIEVIGFHTDDVPHDSRTSNEECEFYNESFINHGLRVCVLSGQGTIVHISNTSPAATA